MDDAHTTIFWGHCAGICVSCLAQQTGLTEARVQGVLDESRDHPCVHEVAGACTACQRQTTLYHFIWPR